MKKKCGNVALVTVGRLYMCHSIFEELRIRTCPRIGPSNAGLCLSPARSLLAPPG